MTIHIEDLIQQVCVWNSRRYEQEYNHELTIQLLVEEHNETVDAAKAEDLVEIADGLADIFYVAVGALWKQGLTASDIPNACRQIEREIKFLPPISIAIEWYKAKPRTAILTLVAVAALQDLIEFTQSTSTAINIIKAVCDSNDTKDAVKTDPAVKANINKGRQFVSPKARIKELLDA